MSQNHETGVPRLAPRRALSTSIDDGKSFKTDEGQQLSNLEKMNAELEASFSSDESETNLDVSSEQKPECESCWGGNETPKQEAALKNTPKKNDPPRLRSNYIVLYARYAVLFIIICVAMLIGASNYKTSEQHIDLSDIKAKFPHQDEELWLSFGSGVEDVVLFNKPSTFILLYEETAKATVSSLLSALSTFATCKITKCDNQPIVLTETELNSHEVIADYGTLLERYRGDLENRGVMIIENLQNVRGVSAQALHAFCDEFTPLVERSLFIFTIKVDQLPGPNKVKFVEEYLKDKWREVKSDTLAALITRITNMILEIS